MLNEQTSNSSASSKEFWIGSGQNSSGTKPTRIFLMIDELKVGQSCQTWYGTVRYYQIFSNLTKKCWNLGTVRSACLFSSTGIHEHILGEHQKITQCIQEIEWLPGFSKAIFTICILNIRIVIHIHTKQVSKTSGPAANLQERYMSLVG